jgi:sensor histidine kinase regulating citrate/malate metabolism
MRYIEYKQKNYRKLILNIAPDTEFNAILKVLNRLTFHGIQLNSDHIIFAVLELVNNSLRAHREKGINDRLRLEMGFNSDTLKIKIEDRGRGFDPARLPYKLDGDAEEVDLNSPDFQAYREKHGYLRFGMGLYLAKKTFSAFNLYFLDNELKPSEWGCSEIVGTCIELDYLEN